MTVKFLIPVLFAQEVDMFHHFFYEETHNDGRQYFIGITTHEEKLPIDTVLNLFFI